MAPFSQRLEGNKAMKVQRRAVLQGLFSSTALVAAPSVLRAQTTPFKIGLLTVKTGPLAYPGIQCEQGITTFIKQKDNILAGRTVELISADTGGSPAGAKTKAQELVEREKVNVILGPVAAAELLAITDYIRDRKTPLIALAAAEDITQRNANPFVIRASASSGQCCHVLGDYAAKELKYKRAATVAEDWAFGHEQMAAFQRVFEEDGGKVVKKLWAPFQTPDYTPYIAQIQNVDCVVNGFAGSNPIRFMRAYADLGAKAKFPLLAGWTAMDDAALRSLGDEAVGVVSASWYSADYASPINKQFVADMRKNYNVLPGVAAACMYIAGQCVEAALKKLDGKAVDGKTLSEALHMISITDSPRGKFRFDHLGNVIGTVFIRKCERNAGQLVNTVIKTYPDVSQFWKYDEKAFLAQPVYSRDYPPAKNLEQ
jgi:branched-chain amino acid transport system substrate-binding protein